MSVGDISAIGYSPLAGYGLPASGMYGNYGDPTMGYLGGFGSSALGFMGAPMMGYDPTYALNYMKQYAAMQGEIDRMGIQSAGATNQIKLQTETQVLANQDEAVFRKAMVDASINTCIRNLAEKIQEGDGDGICIEYDKLKNELYSKFADYFADNAGRVDCRKSVDYFIEMLYSNIVSAQRGGVPTDIRSDIKRFGETAFMHGFNGSFLGKKDYHKKNTEQVLNHIYNTDIDNEEGKQRIDKVGGYVGKGTEFALSVPAGAVAGAGAGVALAGAAKILTLPIPLVKLPFGKMAKGLGKFGAAIGMIALPIADWMWQQSRT